MKKKYFFFLILITLLYLSNNEDVFATDASSTAELLELLKPPQSPAFTLMDIAPASIARPESPKQLALALLSGRNGSNIAVEFTPYWFTSHPDLTFDKLYGIDNQNMLETFKQNFSVDIATIGTASQTGTTIGVGVRSLLWQGNAPEELRDKINQIRKQSSLNYKLIVLPKSIYTIAIASEDDSNSIKDIDNLLKAVDEAQYNDPTHSTPIGAIAKAKEQLKHIINEKVIKDKTTYDELAGFIDEAIDPERRKLATEAQSELSNVMQDRRGFKVEVAYAFVEDYPQSNWNNGTTLKRGFWITPTYTWEKPHFDAILAYRSIEDVANRITNSDIGGRLIWHADEQLAMSGEYLSRSSPSNNSTQRYVFIIEYHFKPDGQSDNILNIFGDTYITGSIGKDFDNVSLNPTQNPNMVAVLGLNWGFGKNPTINY